MALGNYCSKCGHRILPNEPYCIGCGAKTRYVPTNDANILEPPIHNIGFFNLDIDFSPYIESKRTDFKYEICSCGYLNEVGNEFCYMCGSKRVESRFSRFFKGKSKPKFSIDNILCECGTLNSKENIFCEMCGRQLREEVIPHTDNYSNFNLEFKNPIFCFCGEENEKFSQFCKNCGLPLANYGKMNDISILCTCSKINDVTSDFCIECGTNLKKENSITVCICGEKNPDYAKFCQNCDRPLNPQRTIKTRIICSCGEILSWDSEYCHNCGRNIKRSIYRRNSVNNAVKTIKSVFR